MALQQPFEAKRSNLPHDAVERLARQVVERLAAIRRSAPAVCIAPSVPAPDPRRVSTFCDVLLSPDESAALRFLEDVLAPTVSERTALYDYLAAAACQLGEMWQANDVSVVEVAASVGKLYALAPAVGSVATRRRQSRDPRKYALFASVPGEQHRLGVAIAAELFRDAGWTIDLQVGSTHDALMTRARHLRPPVVGLSVSSARRLDALARLVGSLRLKRPDLVIAVAGGGHVDPDTLRNLAVLDLVISDANHALCDLDRLVRQRSVA